MSPFDFLKVAITLRVMKADTSPMRQRVHWSFGCFACVPRALPVRIRFRGLAHFAKSSQQTVPVSFGLRFPSDDPHGVKYLSPVGYRSEIDAPESGAQKSGDASK
jgi:hypothetical protein